jgi:Variant SH3 domain
VEAPNSEDTTHQPLNKRGPSLDSAASAAAVHQPIPSPGMALLLPSQFPCLVKAVFSFAGESKGDLGFVQGDLIECLNAGDGQWWFGRLKRNKTMGVFPSNYVELV